MPSLVVLGAGGFLGRTLLAADGIERPVKAVVRSLPRNVAAARAGLIWYAAELTAPGWGEGILEPGDTVANLAYAPSAGAAENIRLIESVIDACCAAHAARLVHCSTAVVVGRTEAARVTEATPCAPRTPYERTKLAVEQRVIEARSQGLEVCILRPTAIVGPGGQNLLALARSLLHGNGLSSYLRACLFGERNMHLVPARDVVAALLHLAMARGPVDGEVFLVSSDEDPDNRFSRVEAILREALGVAPRALPLLRLPGWILSATLRVRGRSDVDLDRRYASDKLRATGFRPVESVASAVRALGASLRDNDDAGGRVFNRAS